MTDLQLIEPLVLAMRDLLETQMPAVVDAINAAVTDGFTIDHPVQYLPYVPVPSVLEGGMPCIGVQELPARFENDTQFRVDAEHRYAVVATLQNADHETLSYQLRRTMQAIAQTIQQDRLAGNPPGTGSRMKTQGGAWVVNFEGTEPGPLLGDIDPLNPEAPPRTYISWTALILRSPRGEVV